MEFLSFYGECCEMKLCIGFLKDGLRLDVTVIGECFLVDSHYF